MPVYEYGCRKCNHHFEARQKFSDAPLTECPQCGGEVSKLISQTAFTLKGGGWYAEGYGGGGKKSDSAPSCPGAGGGGCQGCPSAA